MRSGSVTCGESLSRDDERCCVRAEVLEKVGKAVEEDEGILVVAEDPAISEALCARNVSARMKGLKSKVKHAP